jgi:sodium-dependent dicarboxylate transporter 2/3/5
VPSPGDDGEASLARAPRLQWAGRLGAPVLVLATFALLPSGDGGLTDAGRWTCALALMMAALWITEALPLPATSLLPILLFPLAGVAGVKETAASYASEVIFLFMGGFILALGMERWGLHRRIALRVLAVAGTRPTRLLGGFMVASAFLSMWISNTATTVMMLPIGVSILRLVDVRVRAEGGDAAAAKWKGFGVALMLGIAYASSAGSLGTLIGTPPNLLLRGFVQRTYDLELSFGTWMLACMPLAALLVFGTWWVLCRQFIKDRTTRVPGGEELLREELARLGPASRGERVVLVVFTLTALLWVVREPLTQWAAPFAPFLGGLSDAGIAMGGALALFIIPVDLRRGQSAMNWETAEKLPWGVLLLFGGGLALATAIQKNGVDAWLGQRLVLLGALPPWLLVVVVIAVVVFLTELTSNTAVTATFLPVLAGVASALDRAPLALLVPAALAATCAFMMPVATPPNAIVFGSGYVTMKDMVRAGLVLNVLAVALITLFAFTTGRLLAGR